MLQRMYRESYRRRRRDLSQDIMSAKGTVKSTRSRKLVSHSIFRAFSRVWQRAIMAHQFRENECWNTRIQELRKLENERVCKWGARVQVRLKKTIGASANGAQQGLRVTQGRASDVGPRSKLQAQEALLKKKSANSYRYKRKSWKERVQLHRRTRKRIAQACLARERDAVSQSFEASNKTERSCAGWHENRQRK